MKMSNAQPPLPTIPPTTADPKQPIKYKGHNPIQKILNGNAASCGTEHPAVIENPNAKIASYIEHHKVHGENLNPWHAYHELKRSKKHDEKATKTKLIDQKLHIVEDKAISFPDGANVIAGTPFEKIWIITNQSRKPTEPVYPVLLSCSMSTSPTILDNQKQSKPILPSLAPKESYRFSLTLIAPLLPYAPLARCLSIWDFQNSKGEALKGRFWVDVNVVKDATPQQNNLPTPLSLHERQQQSAGQLSQRMRLDQLLLVKTKLQSHTAKSVGEHWLLKYESKRLKMELKLDRKLIKEKLLDLLENLEEREDEIARRELELQQRERRMTLQVNPSDIQLEKPIGQGHHSKVYLAKWNEVSVAVKILKDGERTATIATEIALLQQFHHPNVLRLFGICSGKTTDEQWLVLEYASNGSLRSFCEHRHSRLIPYQQQLLFVRDIAAGMSYLHRDHGCLHRDLKSKNILVASDLSLKISDFGISSLHTNTRNSRDSLNTSSGLTSSTSSSGSLNANINPTNNNNNNNNPSTPQLQQKTYVYRPILPPEMLDGAQKTFTESADIFAFSLVMHEILTLQAWIDQFELSELETKVMSGERPPIPVDSERAFPNFISLMRKCWAQNPKDRPLSFSHIFSSIIDLMTNLESTNPRSISVTPNGSSRNLLGNNSQNAKTSAVTESNLRFILKSMDEFDDDEEDDDFDDEDLPENRSTTGSSTSDKMEMDYESNSSLRSSTDGKSERGNPYKPDSALNA